jgi:hypothetical protein
MGNAAPSILQVVEVVAIAVVAVYFPAAIPAIGEAMGLTGTAAVAAGYGAIGAGTGAVNAAAAGADTSQIVEAALKGGASGAVGGAIGAEASGLVPDLGTTGAAAVGGAAKGGIQAGISGGSVGAGAVGGALGSALGTEIGGAGGRILGGAAGSATGAQLSGGDPSKSAVYGGIQGAASGLAKTLFNPQTGQQVAYNQYAPLASNITSDVPTPLVTLSTDQDPGSQQGTQADKEFMYKYMIDQGYSTSEAAQKSGFNPDVFTYAPSTADYSGGGSKSGSFGGTLGTQTTQPLSAGALDVSGKQTSMIDEGGTTQKGQATPSDKPQLITPSIVSSSSGGGQSPQVLSSVLGAPSSSILGQALQSSNPDIATTGDPILEGDGKNKRNVWNTESLRTALGLS